MLGKARSSMALLAMPRPILEPKIGMFLVICEFIFGPLFCQFLDYILDHFWAHFATRSAQEEAKMNPRSQSRASRNEKEQFQKSGFRVGLSAFLRSQGLPRKHQEAQEVSQEAPRELRNLKNKNPQMDPKINVFGTNFAPILGSILGSKTVPKEDQKWKHFWNPEAPARYSSLLIWDPKTKCFVSAPRGSKSGPIFGPLLE